MIFGFVNSLLLNNGIKCSAWNPSTPLRERPQTTARLLSFIVYPVPVERKHTPPLLHDVFLTSEC